MDVEQLLTSKNIDHVPRGGDYLVRCLSPDHDDRNPSMRIDRITGIFSCFSCGFKGNVFSLFGEKANFLQMRKDLLKKKIRNKIAENIGLDLPTGAVPFDRPWREISAETYRQFGAFEHHDSDYIGRVVFPIKNLAGRILGFNGRALGPDKQPRYLISPAGANFPLFPARPTPINGRIILVEGIFDMLNLYDKGLTNAVCAFGTQKVTKEKLQVLKIQGIHGIDIMFDGDDAGAEAAKKVAELAESVELDVRTISLKDKDPGELTASKVIKLKEKLYGKDSPSGDEAE